ncbi:MAG: hypothetical protein JSV04_02180 [Candidatus Heimdallarchaeota archaeon]|nr:MAG: hypothetical protein JSV04_02180 [Candidatus Heimdallarchaeota archaeon]
MTTLEELKNINQLLHKGQLKDALDRVQSLETKIISQHYRVAKAMILKTSSRITQKFKAQELLQNVINEEITEHKLTVYAMFNLCELLIDELKLYGETEVLQKVKVLLTQIYDIALHQQSSQLIVQSLLLQAKFALADGDAQLADELLKQAKLKSEESGLQQFRIQITQEQEILHNEIEKWTRLINQNTPLKVRIEQARLSEYVTKAISLLDKP